MPTIINFGQAKVSAIAFASRDDFAQFMRKCDELYDHGKQYPLFFILADPGATEEHLVKITRFIREKMKDVRDFEMIQRNLDAGRLPELTSDLPDYLKQG